MSLLKQFYYNEDLFSVLSTLNRNNFFLFQPKQFLSAFSYSLVFFFKIKDFVLFEKLLTIFEDFFSFNNVTVMKLLGYYSNLKVFLFRKYLFNVSSLLLNNSSLNFFDFVLFLRDRFLFKYMYDFLLEFLNHGLFDLLAIKIDNRFLELPETLIFFKLTVFDLNKIWLSRYFFFLLPAINSTSAIIASTPTNYFYLIEGLYFKIFSLISAGFIVNFVKIVLFFNRLVFLFYAYFKSITE